MIAWALDTLFWTGALILLVLVFRRSFARAFGPHIAYALWLLPVGRLFFPKIVLPAMPATAIVLSEETMPVGEASVSVNLAGTMIVLWLAGAALVLTWRLTSYFRMRWRLMARARVVETIGRIRIVETPVTVGPLAFGILDPVVALPLGFTTGTDPLRRELAIEHELAHHRGGDLVLNLLVQPLFALHWFSPLGWLGWNALRRDQEAACDARVLARRGAGSRLAYAALIASFVTRPLNGPAFAGAAAMACPVLGAPSIVYRLRNLTMTEVSRFRRCLGLAVLASLGCTLPLTATISYAASVSNASAALLAPEAPAARPAPARRGATGAVRMTATQPSRSANAATTSAAPDQTAETNDEAASGPVPASPDRSRFDDLATDALKRIQEARLSIAGGDRIMVVPEIADRSSFDAIVADAMKQMKEMGQARMADSERTAVTSHIYQQTQNGVPVRTID